MDSHDVVVFTGVKIEIFFMGFDQIFSVNNAYVNTGNIPGSVCFVYPIDPSTETLILLEIREIFHVVNMLDECLLCKNCWTRLNKHRVTSVISGFKLINKA